MANNKLLIIAILSVILMVMPLISAEIDTIDTIGAVKQFTAVSLPQGGSNGTDAWDYCNITSITDPDHLVVLGMAEMTKTGAAFNYTLENYNTSKLGGYIVNTICYDGKQMVPGSYRFEVTTTGKSDSLSFWMSLILIVLAVIILIMAFAFDSVYIAFMSGSVFLVSGLLVYIKGFGSIQDLYSNAIGMVLLGIGLILIFASSFHYAKGEDMSSAFGNKEERDPYDYFD